MGVMATLLKRDYQCAPRGGGLRVICVAWTRDLACGGARLSWATCGSILALRKASLREASVHRKDSLRQASLHCCTDI